MQNGLETTEIALSLPSDKTAPSRARRLLADELDAKLPELEQGTIRLLVTELVANAVTHTDADESGVLLRVELSPALLRVEVCDGGPGFEKHEPVPRGASGGYGLFLVDRMATRWGVERERDNCVWFELERPA